MSGEPNVMRNRTFAALLVCFPIFYFIVRSRLLDNWHETAQAIIAPAGVIVSYLTLCVVLLQTIILDRQRRSMEGQLRATEAAANAALAGLARPWLFVTNPMANYHEWLTSGQQMRVSFTIFNHGNAPAVILSIKAVCFTGEHHHDGTPEHLRPNDFVAFPLPFQFQQFIFEHGGSPATEGKLGESAKLFFLPSSLSMALPSGIETGKLICLGPSRTKRHDNNISLERLCDIYFVGCIKYRLPSQGIETLNFSLKKDIGSFFEVYRDVAPYNQRKTNTGETQ